MQRRSFLGATAGIGVSIPTLATSRTAQAAPLCGEPGCFPATPWSSPFVSPIGDPNTKLKVGVWNLIANGRIFKFKLDAVAGAKVEGGILGGQTLGLTWDPIAKRISFTRRTVPKDTSTDQHFVGYLMDVNPRRSEAAHRRHADAREDHVLRRPFENGLRLGDDHRPLSPTPGVATQSTPSARSLASSSSANPSAP